MTTLLASLPLMKKVRHTLRKDIDHITIKDVEYLAQDHSGEWYGYVMKPMYLVPKRVWVVSNYSPFVFLGKTKLRDNHDTQVYEVTT